MSCLAGLLALTAGVSPTLCSALAASPPAPTPTPPYPSGGTSFRGGPDSEAARLLLEKALRALGGEAVIDGLKTLVLAGTLRQQVEGGDVSAGVRTTFLYPDKVRRDVTVAGGARISTIFTADESFLIGPQGSIDLPQAERERLEASAMRNPVSLLKARRHPLFRASVSSPSGPGAAGRDVLTIGIADQETDVAIDPDGQIVEVAYVGTSGPESAEKAEFRVRYSDFRRVGSLVYPFYAEASFAGRPAYSLRLDSLRVNEELPPTIFHRPAAAPEPPAPSPAVGPSPSPGRSR